MANLTWLLSFLVLVAVLSLGTALIRALHKLATKLDEVISRPLPQPSEAWHDALNSLRADMAELDESLRRRVVEAEAEYRRAASTAERARRHVRQLEEAESDDDEELDPAQIDMLRRRIVEVPAEPATARQVTPQELMLASWGPPPPDTDGEGGGG